jgi:peptidoglycan/LPS O-acetylase OafA/YrhL
MSWPFDLAVVASLCVIVAMLWELKGQADFAFSLPSMPYYFPAFPLAIAVILALAPHTRFVGRVLDNKAARFIATISYGLYIWHYALLELGRLWLWPDDFGTFGVMDATDWFFRIVGVYAVAFLLATLSWYLLEKRIVAWSKGWGRRAPSPPTADAVASVVTRAD